MLRSWFSAHFLDKGPKQLLGLILLAAVLTAAAGIGMAFVAGFGNVWHRLLNPDWWWLLPAAGAVALSFAGYFVAYRGITRTEDGPELETPALLAVVAAGFGGFLAQGATAIDEAAMRAGGAGEREARVRVAALAAFEHGLLALIVCPASVVALALATSFPRADYTWPWAIAPPLGALAVWLMKRHRGRFRERKGWRDRLAIFFDAVDLLYGLFRSPGSCSTALLGMLVYWAAEMFALWATMATFGYHMSVLTTIVCLGTGMIFTRRTGPLGGAGIIYLALVAALWNGGGVPPAAGTLGVALYALLTFWLPLPAALASLRRLRALHEKGEASASRKRAVPA
jgi:uncharacterized membrane protein YbhN (UPF0104 family)